MSFQNCDIQPIWLLIQFILCNIPFLKNLFTNSICMTFLLSKYVFNLYIYVYYNTKKVKHKCYDEPSL